MQTGHLTLRSYRSNRTQIDADARWFSRFSVFLSAGMGEDLRPIEDCQVARYAQTDYDFNLVLVSIVGVKSASQTSAAEAFSMQLLNQTRGQAELEVMI